MHTQLAAIGKVFAIARKVLGEAQIKKRLAREGMEVETSVSLREFAAFIRAEIPFWARLVEAPGATAH